MAAIVGNCIFAPTLRDPWAAFAVGTDAYDLLREDQKVGQMLALASAFEAAGGNLQLLRVADTTSPPQPAHLGASDPTGTLGAYWTDHRECLERVGAGAPRVFLMVAVRDGSAAGIAAALQIAPNLRRTVGRRWPRFVISDRRLADVEGRASQIGLRIGEHLSVRPANPLEIQWLIRRVYCRGVGEPSVDPFHDAAPIAFDGESEPVIAALDGETLRWHEALVEPRLRSLVVHSELGTAHQCTLMFGSLPEKTEFPMAELELMFRPAERLDFPVDLALNARFLPNAAAVRLARRRVQDADQIVRAERDGEHGVSAAGLHRSELARHLLAELQSGRLPPLFTASIAVSIAAANAEELERRIAACRRAFAPVRLHRPVGSQLRLLSDQLVARRPRRNGYEQTVTAQQMASLMPTASAEVGSERGFYLGHTLTESRRPVRFSLREGSDGDQNTAIFCFGALGTGKTTLAQKLCLEALLQGGRVVDCDPKGDHRLHLLDEIAPHAEVVAVRPERSLRGLLDPLRVAPSHLRHETTLSFLRAILPARGDRSWDPTLLTAVDRVIATSARPTCSEVIRAVREAGATDLAELLEIHARSGLTQLGFADADIALPSLGEQPFTYISIRDLPDAPLETRRSELSHSERIGEQIVRMVALLSMQLMADERSRLKVYAFDEGWRLLGDPVGRALLTSLQRMGRSELAVPIISTQLIGDALAGAGEGLDNLFGCAFAFGMRSEREATRALRLLGLDADRQSLDRLLAMSAGRCIFRDYRGRAAATQIDVVPAGLRERLSTTPPLSARG